MSRLSPLILLIGLLFSSHGFAQRDVRPSGAIKGPPSTGPAAYPSAEEIDEQLRNLTGRVESVENQLSMIQAGQAGEKDSVAKERQAMEAKFLAYEEALKKLETQIQSLADELTALKSATEKSEKSEKSSKKSKGKSAYDDGEALLGQKKFKEAILAYQKYRDGNPKGTLYAEATYKIGVCFQELGLKDEAKVFFDEVTSKFPKSKSAKKAAIRAKQLK